MRKLTEIFLVSLAGLLVVSSGVAQDKKIREQRRPPAEPKTGVTAPQTQTQPTYQYFSILNGMPMLLELHHDTERFTGKPIDVYDFVIEMQVVNSDGMLEPVGLQIHNYYTAEAMDLQTTPNPNNARDCKIWNGLVTSAMQNRNPLSPTWPYITFTVAEGARTIQTKEDGQVWWSDDIECWGAKDRFPPF
jgi:hypothetical protein